MNSFYWSREQGHRRNWDEKMVASAQGTCMKTFEKEKQVVSWKISTCKEEAVASLSMDRSRDTSGRQSPPSLFYRPHRGLRERVVVEQLCKL